MRTAAFSALASSLIAAFVASACGRVGYSLSPVGTGGSNTGGSVGTLDAGSGGRTDLPDSSLGTTGGATATGGVTATGGGTATGGNTSTLDASRDPDASRDASRDAAGGCALAASIPSDLCTTLPELEAPPTIDGLLDCGLALVPLTPEAWTGQLLTDGAVPWNATAKFAVAWRPDGLYFFVDVTDPEIIDADPTEETWKGDGVELYVDSDGVYSAPPAYDDPGTRQLVVSAPLSASAPPRAEVWFLATLKSAWQTSELVTVPHAGGYVVEAFVTAPDLGLTTLALAPGGHVGFDLALNVSFSDPSTTTPNGGHRLGQYFLHSTTTSHPFNDVTAFCAPTLSASADR